MKNSQKGFVVSLLIGIIAILVVGGGLYIYSKPRVAAPLVNTETSTQDETLPAVALKNTVNTSKTGNNIDITTTHEAKYTDHAYSLSLPSDFMLTGNLTPAQKETKVSYMDVCSLSSNPYNVGKTVFCYTGEQKSDGFVGAALVIDANGSATEEGCAKPEFEGSGGQTVTLINGLSFRENKLSDAGLGHYLSTDSYRTYHNKVCYTLDLKIESSVGASEKGLNPDFSTMMLAKLKSILSTFQFTE